MELCEAFQTSDIKIMDSNKINSNCIIKKTVCHQNLVDKGAAKIFCLIKTSFLMRPNVTESKFRPMTNSFLPVGGKMLIKTNYGSVNCLIAMLFMSRENQPFLISL